MQITAFYDTCLFFRTNHPPLTRLHLVHKNGAFKHFNRQLPPPPTSPTLLFLRSKDGSRSKTNKHICEPAWHDIAGGGCVVSCLTRPESSLAAIPASWHATSCSQFLLVRPALLYNSFSLLWLFLQEFSYIFTIHSGRYWCNIVRPTPYESQVNRFPLLFLPPPWFPVAYAVRWCLQFQTNRSGADLWLDYSL